jgi:hypothetical protein
MKSASQGISLVTKFIHSVQSEEQVQVLLQCVEYWRSQVPNLNKSNLASVKYLWNFWNEANLFMYIIKNVVNDK